MNPDQTREETLFNAARALTDPKERAVFLDAACKGNPELRRSVEALLSAQSKGDAYFDRGAQDPGLDLTRKDSAGADSPAHEKPGDRIGRYKLREKIGEGGCGIVYVAEQEEPVRRRVALKVIKLGMDTRQVVARFEAERQALAMMDHPNIAKIFDAGITGQRSEVRDRDQKSEVGAALGLTSDSCLLTSGSGRPYFVMELVRGIRITDYCDQSKLSTRQRLDLFVQVCNAVQHAHQKGIIHRDLKPSNILVTLHDGVPVPKVIDFGIAKATEGRLTDLTVYTELHQFIGTPAYMSPEQAEMSGLDIDTRSDIYSLGVLLYELLTGRTPFDATKLLAAGLDEIRRTIREVEPPRPSTRLSTLAYGDLTTVAAAHGSEPPKLVSLIRGDLDWIVMKALEKDRTRRYETANGLAADLKRHLSNEPVVARPPSTGYRLQKAWRRNKLAFTAATAVASALVIGIVVSSWQAVEARRAKDAEKEQRLAAQTAQQAEKQARLRADAEKIEARRFLYVANMNLAQEAWEQNNMVRLRKLLQETQEFPDRGFEWYYWQRQTHLALQTLRGHLQSVSSVAFSPDGQRIVTGSWDQTAKVWGAASGRELLTLKGHDGLIWSVAFSPDGRLIVTGGDDQTARIWDATSGRELLLLKGHSGSVWSVAFSPDSQRIVTGSNDRTAKVWDADSGRALLTLEGHSARIRSVAFSPKDQRIVTGSFDETAKVWDAANGRELLTLKGHNGWVLFVALSPDGQRIVTGSNDRTAKVWEAESGRELLTLKGHGAPIVCAAFSPDGQRIVTGSRDQTLKVWEADSGRELLTLKGHSATIWSAAFSPDGQRIVTGSSDQTARVWEATNSRQPLTLKGHSARIWAVAFSLDSQRIITGSGDRTARVWEADSGRELLLLRGHIAPIESVAFSPDGQRIVTGSADQTAKVWEASGRELLTLKGHTGSIRSVAFSPDGQRIVTGSLDQTAKVWEAESGRELLTLKGHSDPVRSIAFSPNGRRIVTGSFDHTAKVWEADSGRELLPLKGHSGPVRSVAFSPDGTRIVTGSSDETVKVWEEASGRELLTLKGHGAPIVCVAFSPDGHRIITGSEDHTAKVWEVDSGRELLTLNEHSAPIAAVAFSPDGHRIITGSEDHTAKIWQAARVEQVAAWLEEERTAAQYLAALQSERNAEQERKQIPRTPDEGAIKRWLILAPIPLASGQNEAEGLDTEQIEGEDRLRPKAGEGTVIESAELKWQEIAQRDYIIDFNMILEHLTPQSVAYAACYIRSETEQRGLRMLVGSDDTAKVYLNGKLVHKSAFGRSFVVDQDIVPNITLDAGLNVIVFKVVNGIFDWKGSLRLTDRNGNPVKGIKVSLEP